MYNDKQQQKRNNDSSNGSNKDIIKNKTKNRHCLVLSQIYIGGIFIIIFVLYPPIKLTNQYLRSLKLSSSSKHDAAATATTTGVGGRNNCSYRDYGSKGLYGMSHPTYPHNYEFLRSSLYIHGKQPIILPTVDLLHQQQQTPSYLRTFSRSSSTATTTKLSGGKLCFDVDKYMNSTMATNFSTSSKIITPEGSNPTLISFERILNYQNQEMSSFQKAIIEILSDYPTAAYIVSTTSKNTNHQCGQTGGERQPLTSVGFHVNIMIVDIHMNTLLQTIVQIANDRNPTLGYYRPLVGDDARLFIHDNKDNSNNVAEGGGSNGTSRNSLWMNYKRYDIPKNGNLLFMSQLQIEYTKHNKILLVTTLPGQDEDEGSLKLCCGRNFAVLPSSTTLASQPVEDKQLSTSSGKLSFLTWPDPVWVQEINTNQFRMTYHLSDPPQKHDKKKSYSTSSSSSSSSLSNLPSPPSFHGTSSTLLFIPETKEYLGVGHIHREAGYTGVGHHYTHAFFTMTGDVTSAPPNCLSRVSNEFVFESKYVQDDADLIQFATGLEWAPTTTITTPTTSSGNKIQNERMIAIGYGIMDCESSVVYVTWDVVDSMLQNVAGDSNTSTETTTSTTTARCTQVAATMKVNQEWDLDLEAFTKMSETMDSMS